MFADATAVAICMIMDKEIDQGTFVRQRQRLCSASRRGTNLTIRITASQLAPFSSHCQQTHGAELNQYKSIIILLLSSTDL